MKSSFWLAGLFVGGFLAMAVNCGPQHPYCPEAFDMECRPAGLDSGPPQGGTGGMDRGPCDGGAISVAADGAITCL